MVHFRKRLDKDIINQINEMIANSVRKPEDEDSQDNDKNDGGANGQVGNASDRQDDPKGSDNQGKFILDATCVPTDIHFPTYIWRLNTAREALEEIIDVLHRPYVGTSMKPRMYRDCARRDCLNIDKRSIEPTRKSEKVSGNNSGISIVTLPS